MASAVSDGVSVPPAASDRIGGVLVAAVFASVMAFYLRIPGLREGLFALTLVYAIQQRRLRLPKSAVPLLAYIVIALLVGVHTFLLFGATMATAGTIRFLAATLLAPLAAVFVVGERDVRLLLGVWLIVVVVGVLTAVYQYAGGDLTWALGPHTVRGGVLRIRTSLGEVNVGGMAAPIVAVLALSLVRGIAVRGVLLATVVAHMAFSLSKAGVLGLGITGLLYATVLRGSVVARGHAFRSIASALVVIAVSVYAAGYAIGFGELSARLRIFEAILIHASDQSAPTIGGDVYQRVVTFAVQGARMSLEQGTAPLLNIILGTSYGVAGSAAVEHRFGSAILPHNAFVEAFLVGGIVLVILLAAVIGRTIARLWAVRRRSEVARVLLACVVILVAYMPAYPVIYQPVLGGLFWVIVGIAHSPWMETLCEPPASAA
jgi:hypothetical protein